MANEEYLRTFEPGDVKNLSTDELRVAVVKGELYSQRETIATLPISAAEVVSKPGTLTVLDKAIAALIACYAGREPEVKTSYRGTVEITVWQTDDSIRDALRYQVERAHEAAGAFND